LAILPTFDPDIRPAGPAVLFLVPRLSKLLEFGRRDWIRTNDPHHVKVVL